MRGLKMLPCSIKIPIKLIVSLFVWLLYCWTDNNLKNLKIRVIVKTFTNIWIGLQSLVKINTVIFSFTHSFVHFFLISKGAYLHSTAITRPCLCLYRRYGVEDRQISRKSRFRSVWHRASTDTVKTLRSSTFCNSERLVKCLSYWITASH